MDRKPKWVMRLAHILVAIAIVCWILCTLIQCYVAFAEEAAAAPARAVDLTNLLQALLAVLCSIITGYLVPWLKAKAGREKQEMVSAAVDIAVSAAQQLYETHVISDRLDYACKWLNQRGIIVDRAQVEAGVRRYKANSLTELIGAEAKEAEAA